MQSFAVRRRLTEENHSCSMRSRMSGGEAVKGPGMEHTRLRKPLCGQFETTNPGVPVPLTTSLERLSSVAKHALPE